MQGLKKYFYIGIATSILIMSIHIRTLVKEKSTIEEKWKTAVENVKTYSEQYSSSENKNRALKLTVEQLNYSNDSILQELNETRKKLGVKDSKVESVQYISSTFTKVDTILLRDTVFRDEKLDIDTLISDEWYSVKLGLKYPSSITIEPTLKSVKNIIVSYKKETVNPPKKFFLFRWFQKKQTVLNIDVIEKNPYILNQDNRFVKVIR